MTEEEKVSPRLLKALAKEAAITPMSFALYHSGQKGFNFIDIDNIIGDVGNQTILSKEIIEGINSLDISYNKLAFLDKGYGPTGLLPLASSISSELNEDFSIIRLWDNLRFDELKIKGVGISNEDEILLFDDVVTTGNTQERAVDLIERQEGTVTAIYSVVERGIYDNPLENLRKHGITCDSLLTDDDLKYTGLVMEGNEDEYLHKNFIEEFAKAQKQGEKLYNIERMEQDVEQTIQVLLDQSNVETNEEIKNGLKNIYFQSLAHINREETFSETSEGDWLR